MLTVLSLTLFFLRLSKTHVSAAGQVPLSSVVTSFSLTTSTVIPFPSATQSASDASSFITSQWSLNKGHIQNGGSNVAFVDDPFPNSPAPGATVSNTSGPVLQVTYAAGTYGSVDSGAQWYSLWNTTDGSQFQSMLLSYELAFDSNFNWVQGGKLPGLRGGSDVDDCSGGVQANGTNCFSARLMWRKNAQGEVYAYTLTPNNICSDSNIICNSDYGVSIDRGSFGFETGHWSRITILVQLNNDSLVANGNIILYFNDVQVLSQQNLYFRTVNNVTIGGLYFSTFFGGGDSSWATPQTVHTYYRNIQMWGSSSPSLLAGQTVNAALSSCCKLGSMGWTLSASVLLTLLMYL
ncbi:polysaccharide lyase family 14 protein [Suillus fuscotomentosus]|uniref:Polysaccharide lyase family 14 protein n=1 Tax=Suillus fuscotomentosus TaxID=1912939 RepID=A0AAD4E1K5_9AGAM|nr:polysaccharide lyase family 14 protein [Suillus fuscotomentosus]KAG1898029.1 polysaccharide lyase family 14 protein [Suillus fuscotomentosus]